MQSLLCFSPLRYVEAHTSSQTMYINIPHDKAVDTFSLPGHEYEPWSGNEEEVETQIEAEGATENTGQSSDFSYDHHRRHHYL